MSLFNLFSKKTTNIYKEENQPYKDPGLNKIYNLLFCDNIELYQNGNSLYPWDILLANRTSTHELETIACNANMETRQRILANNLLLKKGIPSFTKEVLGVIIEVALEGGLDVLAAYQDGTARYINHSEKLLIWETKTNYSTQLINKLFKNSSALVHEIGPWDKERKPFPTRGNARLSFLVSDGLYFGEGSFANLQKDPMGGSVLYAATELMIYLTEQRQP